MSAWGGGFITGLGMTQMSRGGNTTVRVLAVEACRRAIEDAGVQRSQIDGLLMAHSPVVSCHELGARLQYVLGLRNLGLLQDVHAEGTSVGQMIHTAALYINAGLVQHVLCVFADAAPGEASRAVDAFAGTVSQGFVPGWEAAYGFFGAVGAYAMAARRHMTLYGTNEDHFAAVATSARVWAAGNPNAVARTPLTIAGHHASPMIVEPFRELDCADPISGGVAVVVSASADGPHPVHISGIGQGHRGNTRQHGQAAEADTGAAVAAQAALSLAGMAVDDVDICELYDCFTYATIVSLEDFGFCLKGEGGDFVADGHIAPGGSIPTNTGGGQLSGYYLQGMTPLSEALIQLRGEGGERQVPNAHVALVGTQGGILDNHACLILTTEERSGRR